MNLIPKIAEELGVEIGEEFKLQWNGVEQTGLFRFTNYRLESKFQNKEDWGECSVSTELLNGGITIIKLPFEPKRGDTYWYMGINDMEADSISWRGSTGDYCFKLCGNCFRTKAEAEREKYNVYERLTGKKWEE